MWRVVTLIVAGLSLSLACPGVSAADGEEKKPTDGEAERITLEQFEKKRKEKDVVVLDVRTPEEFEAGHVPGATNLNFRDEKFAEKVAALDKGKTYLVYCATGRRSTGATGKMKELGFGKLFNFTGSMAAWNKADKPVEKGPGENKPE
jgi:rhodanese-related sulfurtransferase